VRVYVRVRVSLTLSSFPYTYTRVLRLYVLADDERRRAEQTLDRMLGEIERIKAAERRRREMEERLLQRMNESEGQLREAKAEEVCDTFQSRPVERGRRWLSRDGVEEERQYSRIRSLHRAIVILTC